MNLFIAMGNIQTISDIKKAKNSNHFVSAALWTEVIGIEKEFKNTLINFQAFDDAAFELHKFKDALRANDKFLVLGFATISPSFKGITIQKIIKITDEAQVNNFFKNDLWKML